MAVGFRSSSSGANNGFAATVDVPVPSGAAADDVALVGVQWWSSEGDTITGIPAGFTQVAEVASGFEHCTVYWKRLSTAETGTWTFEFGPSNAWGLGQAATGA